MAAYNDDKAYRTESGDDQPVYDNPNDYEHMSVGRYLATRLPTLKPPMHKAPNPFKLLAMLNFQQWMFFLVAFSAWTWDAFDFFTVSLTVTPLAEQFGKTSTDITWGITLVLMFRSVGSVIFGKRFSTISAPLPSPIPHLSPFPSSLAPTFLSLDTDRLCSLNYRHCGRSLRSKMALHRQQPPFYRPRARHRLLPNLFTIPGLSSPIWNRYGRFIW